MLEKLKKIFTAVFSFAVSWLMLSFVFFPAEPEAPAEDFLGTTLTHMVPLKLVITLIFVLLSVFMQEQRAKKKRKSESQIDNVSK